MKVKRGLIKGAAPPAEVEKGAEAAKAAAEETTKAEAQITGAEPPAAAAAQGQAAADKEGAPGEGAPAGAAPAAQTIYDTAAEARATEAEAALPEELPAGAAPVEVAPTEVALAEAAKIAALAEEEKTTQKLIEVNIFMKGFFESFDENNVVVKENDFPDFTNTGILSEKIINENRQKEIKSNIGILNKYIDFLNEILLESK
tara:strand:- start:886 stop:1491 length:606 start_codon:yes stop_codon:yes gene_type:complete